MINDQGEYLAKIEAHVATGEAPYVTSLDGDTHIFHFEGDGRLANAMILFVNRNGNQFRVIREPNEGNKWRLYKTWNGVFDHQSWMRSALMNDSHEDLIKLCGVGPQGSESFEQLCLLPKGTTNRRKIVFRDQILSIRFDVDNNRFTLSWPPGVADSKSFSGKPWLSIEATNWCLERFNATQRTPEEVEQDEEAQHALEGSDMWGMF